MIAKNFRRYPEALALQLQLQFGRARRKRASGESTCNAPARPPAAAGLLRFVTKPKDAEDVPIGAIVQTPTGARARVEGYRGFRRDHRVRLVCRYLDPVNKRYDIVQLLPELVTVITEEEAQRA